MPSGTGLDAFSERFPSRFHDTGITEVMNLSKNLESSFSSLSVRFAGVLDDPARRVRDRVELRRP